MTTCQKGTLLATDRMPLVYNWCPIYPFKGTKNVNLTNVGKYYEESALYSIGTWATISCHAQDLPSLLIAATDFLSARSE